MFPQGEREQPSPFFIVGFQRSGTTLLRVMLDSHPDVAIPLDTVGLWARYELRLKDYDHLLTPEGRERIVHDVLADERIRLWETPLTSANILRAWSDPTYPGLIDTFHREYAKARGRRIWGDKDPGNMLRMSRINRWFPACRFLHIIRDGRDACLSQLQQDFGFDDVLPCAAAWREQVWWVREIGSLLGAGRYLELRYEDLVTDPEKELRIICRFLGIEFSPGMLQYHKQLDNSIPKSKRHLWPLLAEPPRRENAGAWKSRMSPAQRLCFEKRAGTVLRELGYDTLEGRPSGGYTEELKSLARRAGHAVLRRFRPGR